MYMYVTYAPFVLFSTFPSIISCTLFDEVCKHKKI